MPTINPDLVPTINPGNLFNKFTTSESLNIQWLTATDPAYFETLNRPIADTVLRQLILSKAIDNLNVSLGNQALYPFVITPQITDGSTTIEVPLRVIWDISASIPTKWINLRLARIDRLDGENPGSGTSSEEYTGTLRFIFSAQQNIDGSTLAAEIALFYADYEIDSELTFQRIRIEPADSSAVPSMTTIGTSEKATIDGDIIFNTLDTTDTESQEFLDLVAPGSNAQYELVDTAGVSSTSSLQDLDDNPISHGTGILTNGAYNLITAVDADPITWIEAFNYPFELDASLQSDDSNNTTIPRGLFREMDIMAPGGDEATGDTSGTQFPVWISSIEKDVSESTPTLIFTFSTNSVEPSNPSQSIEFATMTLTDDMIEGQIVPIIPDNNLFFDLQTNQDWFQEFGRGHVVLSEKWNVSSGEVSDFFNSFPTITGGSVSVSFDINATRISSWGISRTPKFSPTAGQAEALKGTSSERDTPLHPSQNNKYVTELDEGLGDIIDLEAESNISAHSAIDRYGNAGTRIRKAVKLIVDPEKASAENDPDFYEDEVLPRLQVLLGRSPIFGDVWFTGSKFLTFNGDSWQG